MSIQQKCKVEGCDSLVKARSVCGRHLHRLYRHGNPETLIRPQNMHGLSSHSMYKSWQAMIDRCYNKNHKAYKDYGGRGISVCKRWRNNFANFLKDMGERPEGMTLERTNNNKGYSLKNCCWATRSEQQLNRRPTGKSGHLGIHYDVSRKKWKATMHIKGKPILNKRFSTIQEAIEARKLVEISYRGKTIPPN